MGFVCPECSSPESLEITSSIDLDADSRSDEIAVQTVECSICRFKGAAVYEESRRGALDSESWDHYGYKLDSESFESLRDIIAACPKPSHELCECETHRALNRTDKNGRWNALDDYDKQSYFFMRRVRN